MANELTEAHYAAMETLDAAVFTSKAVLVTEDAREEIARDLVEVVRPVIAAEELEKAADALRISDRLRSFTDDHMGDIEEAAVELDRMAAALRSNEKGTTNAE